jgi:death on curing protein
MERLSVEELLLIAEMVLAIPAETIARASRLGAAASALDAPFPSEDGRDRYPGLAGKAAVLCSRLVRNHPLPDGNKRVALIAMLDFIERNGGDWVPPAGGQDEIAATIERLAARELSEADFAVWLRPRLAPGS